MFLVTAARGAQRPFLFDEANFLFQATAVAERGVPYANMGYMGDRGRITDREQYGLWHPPLYLYLLGANVKLFGPGEAAARGLGIAIVALTALVVFGLGHTVGGGGARGGVTGLLATLLFLVSPLLIQSATVVDIDGTLLLLAMSAWSLAYLRWERGATVVQLAALGVLLAFALWTKTTTPLALVGLVVIYQTLARRPLEGLRQAVVILGVGLPLFLGSWWLVAQATRMPFEMPFQWTAWELLDASGYTRSWLGDLARMRVELAPSVVWTSPYLIGAYAVVALARLIAWLRTRRAEPVDFALLLGGLIFVAYFIKLAANFPKYHVGMLPFWAVAIAWWLVAGLSTSTWTERFGYLLAGAAATGYFLSAVQDRWLWTPTDIWSPLILGPALGLVALAACLLLLPATRAAAPRVGAVLIALFVGWAIAVDWAQAHANYSTTFYYGTRGQREVAALFDRLGYDGPWIGPKEVAWYSANQRYIDADTFWWLVLAQHMRFDGEVLGHDVRVVIPWTMDPDVETFFWDQLHTRFEPVGEAANYTVWVRRDTLGAVAQLSPRDTGTP